MGITTIVTLSNKPALLPEAIASVMAQTRPCRHIWAFDGAQDWAGRYPPAVWANQEWGRCDLDDYVAWLSDDDVLLPNYAADLAGHLDAHPEHMAVYGLSQHVTYDPATGIEVPMRVLPLGDRAQVFDASNRPLCKLDGGQVMVRRSALEQLPRPWVPEKIDGARVCDGAFLDKLALAFGIYPAAGFVMRNRATPYSAHSVSRGNYWAAADWRRER